MTHLIGGVVEAFDERTATFAEAHDFADVDFARGAREPHAAPAAANVLQIAGAAQFVGDLGQVVRGMS